MTRKPWPLVLLALLQILSPLANVLFNAWVLRVSPGQVLSWIFEQPALRVFEMLALMPIAGLAIYQMKRWSYLVFFVAIAWSAVSQISHSHYVSTNYPWAAVILAYGLQVALVLYFLSPRVRATYLDPTVRWWETKPRYELGCLAQLQVSGASGEATILNLSEGGAFLRAPMAAATGQNVVLWFEIAGQRFEIEGKVVDMRELQPGSFAYGLRFAHSPESAARFKRLARGLKLLGVPERSQKRPWHQEFQHWLVTLLKTGRGILPEPKRRKS